MERDTAVGSVIIEDKQFQLTRSRGAWPIFYFTIRLQEKFQLTRSRGAWLGDLSYETDYENFNSHAHVERDWQILWR